jgi:hypothetical protein
VSFKFTSTKINQLRAMAKAHGRNVTDQVDFLIDHAARDLGWKLYGLQPAPIRLAKIEAAASQLLDNQALIMEALAAERDTPLGLTTKLRGAAVRTREVAELWHRAQTELANSSTTAAMPAASGAAENAAADPEHAAPDPEPIPAVRGWELIYTFTPRGFGVVGKPGDVAGPLRPGFFHILADPDENVVVVLPDGTIRKTGLSVDQWLQVFDEVMEAGKSGRHKAASLSAMTGNAASVTGSRRAV